MYYFDTVKNLITQTRDADSNFCQSDIPRISRRIMIFCNKFWCFMSRKYTIEHVEIFHRLNLSLKLLLSNLLITMMFRPRYMNMFII